MVAGGGASRRGRSANAEVREGEMGAGAVKHQAGPEAMQNLGTEYVSVRKGASLGGLFASMPSSQIAKGTCSPTLEKGQED